MIGEADRRVSEDGSTDMGGRLRIDPGRGARQREAFRHRDDEIEPTRERVGDDVVEAGAGAEAAGRELGCLVQVDFDGDSAGRAGAQPTDVDSLAAEIESFVAVLLQLNVRYKTRVGVRLTGITD